LDQQDEAVNIASHNTSARIDAHESSFHGASRYAAPHLKVSAMILPMGRLVLISGWTGAGKSTVANAIATDLACVVGSFDWLMSGLRVIPEVWSVVELPVERQRAVGWSLLGRLAEQELRRGRDAVLDLVAREEPRQAWVALAARYAADFSVVECICSDLEVHRARVHERRRNIPGWYELSWPQVERGRTSYQPLREPKLVIDAVDPIDHNLALVRQYLDLAAKS
jgi:predicted kinase